MPVSANTKVNLVPVDYIAENAVLTFNQNTEGLTFHLTAPYILSSKCRRIN